MSNNAHCVQRSLKAIKHVAALLVAVLCATRGYAAIPPSERTALLDLYTTTQGTTWTRSNGWLGPIGTECQWFGVTCNSDATYVYRLDLQVNNLAGPLPSTLNHLSRLEELYVYGNQLSGAIPSLSGLASLRVLDLSQNHLTGSIPSLDGLGALRSFEVRENRLTGSIPRLEGLHSLESFTVSGNRLTGTIPSLAGLNSLRFFRVENNQLIGAIPSVPSPNNLAANGSILCPNLLTPSVDAAWDAATPGTIWSADCPAPIPISERAALVALYNSTNGANWTNRSNWLGPIGSECTWYGVICDTNRAHVVLLGLGANNLSGTLPSALNQLAALRVLLINSNQLTGNIPSLSGMPELWRFLAYSNRFTGSIPSLAGATALREFDVSSNQLTGSIPALQGLIELRIFEASNNSLSGMIPPIRGLPLLQVVGLGNNQLTGAIPALNGLAELQRLNLRNNRLSGTIPSLSALSALQLFDASTNQLNGSIPPLDGLTALSRFFVNNNLLIGPIPELTGLVNLEWFQANDNRLSGTIPSLAGLNSLRALRVENNQLTGGVPAAPSPTNVLLPEESILCPNPLTITTDSAWDAATPGVLWSTACVAEGAAAIAVPSTGHGRETLLLGILIVALAAFAQRESIARSDGSS